MSRILLSAILGSNWNDTCAQTYFSTYTPNTRVRRKIAKENESDTKLMGNRQELEAEWKKLEDERLEFEREKEEISRNMEEITQMVEAERLKWKTSIEKLAVERRDTMILQKDLEAERVRLSGSEIMQIQGPQREELDVDESALKVQKEHIARASLVLENEKKQIEEERAKLEMERKRMNERKMRADQGKMEAKEMTERLTAMHELLKSNVESLNMWLEETDSNPEY